MIYCPVCDTENIEGVDACEACGQSLSDTHLPEPATAVERALLRDRVWELSPRPAYSVSPSTPVRDVLTSMAEKRIGCVVVVEEGRVAGIFTERDALLKINTQAAELGGHPVSEFMTAAADTLRPASKIAFAVHRMDLGGYRHVPIVNEDEQLVGVISVRDILRYLTQKASQPA